MGMCEGLFFDRRCGLKMSAANEMTTASGEMARPVGVLELPRPAKCWLAALTVLLIVTWLGFVAHLLFRKAASQARGSVAPVAVAEEAEQPRFSLGPTEVVEGPWGRLKVVPITISPPPEFLDQRLEEDSREVVWHFPNVSLSRLNQVLGSIGLSDPLVGRLRSLAEFSGRIRGCTIRPGRELVLGLNTQQRTKLYILLHRLPGNTDQRNGFQFRGDSIDAWFGDVSLSPETKRLVTPLIYRHGSFLFFSDLRSIAPSLPSIEERASLVQAVAHESTFLLRLEVSQASDVESLVEYWGRVGREREVRPILESICKLPGKQELDVTQLLPPFARQRIYTYPTIPGKMDRSISRDCHWTSLNFFSDQPDDRYGHRVKAFASFATDYHRIYADPQFGDLVLYVDDKNHSIHSAIYIAADIVFTKNGSSIVHPWMFMKLKDMDGYYPMESPTKVVFRPRGA